MNWMREKKKLIFQFWTLAIITLNIQYVFGYIVALFKWFNRNCIWFEQKSCALSSFYACMYNNKRSSECILYSIHMGFPITILGVNWKFSTLMWFNSTAIRSGHSHNNRIKLAVATFGLRTCCVCICIIILQLIDLVNRNQRKRLRKLLTLWHWHIFDYCLWSNGKYCIANRYIVWCNIFDQYECIVTDPHEFILFGGLGVYPFHPYCKDFAIFFGVLNINITKMFNYPIIKYSSYRSIEKTQRRIYVYHPRRFSSRSSGFSGLSLSLVIISCLCKLKSCHTLFLMRFVVSNLLL